MHILRHMHMHIHRLNTCIAKYTHIKLQWTTKRTPASRTHSVRMFARNNEINECELIFRSNRMCVCCSTACCCMTFCMHTVWVPFVLCIQIWDKMWMNWNDKNTFDFVIMIVEFRNWIMFVIPPLRDLSFFGEVAHLVKKVCTDMDMDMHQVFHSTSKWLFPSSHLSPSLVHSCNFSIWLDIYQWALTYNSSMNAMKSMQNIHKHCQLFTFASMSYACLNMHTQITAHSAHFDLVQLLIDWFRFRSLCFLWLYGNTLNGHSSKSIAVEICWLVVHFKWMEIGSTQYQ